MNKKSFGRTGTLQRRMTLRTERAQRNWAPSGGSGTAARRFYAAEHAGWIRRVVGRCEAHERPSVKAMVRSLLRESAGCATPRLP